MTIRHLVGKALRRLFPAQMKNRDRRIRSKVREERLDAFVKQLEQSFPHTREEWAQKLNRLHFEKTGREINWDNPTRYSEKIQWRKLNDNHPVYSVLADKYRVRQWVSKKIGEQYLIPLLGVWDRAEDIDFQKLPDQFVLKTNNASGTNWIVRNKAELNEDEVIDKFSYWLRFPFWSLSGEFHYKSIAPKVIAEKYMLPVGSTELPDYKFFCYHGKVEAMEIMTDRMNPDSPIKLTMFDRDFVRLPIKRVNYEVEAAGVEKPCNYEEMVMVAETLAQGFSHVRVDLYNIDGAIYFGEMTFTSASGFIAFEPDEWDERLGALWDITQQQVDEEAVGLLP